MTACFCPASTVKNNKKNGTFARQKQAVYIYEKI